MIGPSLEGSLESPLITRAGARKRDRERKPAEKTNRNIHRGPYARKGGPYDSLFWLSAPACACMEKQTGGLCPAQSRTRRQYEWIGTPFLSILAVMVQMLATLLALIADGPGSLEGRWINPAQSVIILIEPCGEAFCGTVEWASDKAKADALKGTDQLVGTQLLSNVRQRPNGRWQGRLFVPDLNKRVHAKIEMMGDNSLKVSGCALGRSLCKSQLWERAQ